MITLDLIFKLWLRLKEIWVFISSNKSQVYGNHGLFLVFGLLGMYFLHVVFDITLIFNIYL